MQSLGYDVFVYGKLHIGAGIMQLPSQSNATNGAFEQAHASNAMASYTRSANIDKAYGSNPVNSYNDNTADPHKSDEEIITKCLERLATLGQEAKNNENMKPFMLYCSVDIPHPPYQTNSTWLKGVNSKNITIPWY